ncbi:aryl-sulfate sulfotransferase [bacterium]|nr:aryl-sulfate sulfotransferase [bacterium]
MTDTFRCGNGYETDSHVFLMTADGHAFMIGLDHVQTDLSGRVPGGWPNASVIECVVQELDQDKSVIFEWRTIDHMNVEDAVYEDLTQGTIDYSHLNSVALDYDNQLLISQRNLSEVSKIDRQTGAFVWRLGGVHNQFTYINETAPISYQHHFRPVPGKPGHYTILDNGNFRDPQYTRAVEYKIDPAAMTAEKVWEYLFPPDGHYTEMMCSVQLLPKGNRLIDGPGFTYTWADEINENNEAVQHLYINGISSYRTMRFEWDGVAAVPDLFVEADNEKVILGMNKFGDTEVDHFNIYHGLSDPPVSLIAVSTEPLYEIRDIKNQTRHYFRVTAVHRDGTESPPSEVQSIMPVFYILGGNLIRNQGFENTDQWTLELEDGAAAEGRVEDGTYVVRITSPGDQITSVQLIQTGLLIENGFRYQLEFDACASVPRSIAVRIEKGVSPFTSYGRIIKNLGSAPAHFVFDFEMKKDSNPGARISFQCGKYEGDVFINDVSLQQIVPTSVRDRNPEVCRTFELLPNYPNPFNGVTRVSYKINSVAFIKFIIFNMQGQRIKYFCTQHNSRDSTHCNGTETTILIDLFPQAFT